MGRKSLRDVLVTVVAVLAGWLATNGAGIVFPDWLPAEARALVPIVGLVVYRELRKHSSFLRQVDPPHA